MSNSVNNNSHEVRVNVTLVEDNIQYSLKIFQITIFSLVCFLGTIGNGLVIWFCLIRMEKTVNVIWFLNLAIADFTFAMSLPFIITSMILDYHWPFGDFLCKFIWFLFFLNMATSVLQLMVISLDRCVSVVFPVWCHNYRTRRLALVVVLIIWVISATLTLPSYIFRRTVGNDGIACITYYGKTWVPMMRFILFFLVPFIIIISCYVTIVLRIKDKTIIKSSKPFRLIISVVTSFFVCWFPYHFSVLFGIYGTKNNFSRFGNPVSVDLMLFNSCINPILYVFIGRDFKQKFCGSIQTMLEKAFTEDLDKTDFKKSQHHMYWEDTSGTAVSESLVV
ncbi:hypothetical protein GDO81_025996 [Engystomops pustulosus]|uniref:G-protein coupled receptors family 1 profile domain-containing protein n=1 Tax=Engystomops pustulosus TaxID=76066 RepID=A0AAV6ZGI0_ENGPU|nr:hypothetical protein GDO81_025996 [Engystomops pustulosus]